MADCACVAVPPAAEGAGQLLFFFELTSDCNNACPGCGNVFARDRSREPLSAQEWIAILDRIAANAFYLQVTGGEPTLHPGFEEIIGYIGEMGIPFSLFTNARWPDPKQLVSLLDQVQPDALLISLHGASTHSHQSFTSVPGSLAETVENIRYAAERDLRVITSTVLTRHNCAEIEEIVALGRSVGVCQATFQRYIGAPLPDLEPKDDVLRRAVEAIERIGDNGRNQGAPNGLVRFGTPIPQCFAANGSNGCRAGETQVTIDPWGNVRPCNHTPAVLGNLLSQSLSDIMDSPTLASWHELVPEMCRQCSVVDACRGGCRATAIHRGLRVDPLINMQISHSSPIATQNDHPGQLAM